MKLKLFIFTACLVVVGAGIANLVPAIAGSTIKVSGGQGEEQPVTVEGQSPKESNTTIEVNEPEPTEATQAPTSAPEESKPESNNEVKPTINPCES